MDRFQYLVAPPELERLEIEQPAKGKSGEANSSDKKSAKQMVANPTIQQASSKCPVCGLNNEISQCRKEEARLNAEATKRGVKFPGADKSASRNYPLQKQECEERTDEHYGSTGSLGCFMCFALGNP